MSTPLVVSVCGGERSTSTPLYICSWLWPLSVNFLYGFFTWWTPLYIDSSGSFRTWWQLPRFYFSCRKKHRPVIGNTGNTGQFAGRDFTNIVQNSTKYCQIWAYYEIPANTGRCKWIPVGTGKQGYRRNFGPKKIPGSCCTLNPLVASISLAVDFPHGSHIY